MSIGIYKRTELHSRKKNLGRECYIENHVCHIPLSNGQIALCDEDRFEEVNKHNWCTDGRGCPKTSIRDKFEAKQKFVNLHKFLYPGLEIVDHISRNILDNRSCNLRDVTKGQNNMNKTKQQNNKTGYKGVCFKSDRQKYHAQIKFEGKVMSIGFFGDVETAAKAYDKRAKELFGEYAVLNFPAVII